MPKKRRRKEKAQQRVPAVAEMSVKLPLEIYLTEAAAAVNKEEKIGIDVKDMRRVIEHAHESDGRNLRRIRGELYYGRIQARERNSGAIENRYVVATKLRGRYFILDFYKKSEKTYLKNKEIVRLRGRAEPLLAASETDIENMLKSGSLIRLYP